MEIIKTILYSDAGNTWNNIGLLAFRILLAIELFRVHGMKKFQVSKGEKEHVPNPFNLPDKLNAAMAAISDTVIPLFVVIGLGSRLIVIPIICVTGIGYFVVHRKDSAAIRDVPYMYTLSFLFLLILGFGTFSVDHYLFNLIF
jgi:putative oxidoreductase